jgi:hypothetical protein
MRVPSFYRAAEANIQMDMIAACLTPSVATAFPSVKPDSSRGLRGSIVARPAVHPLLA